MGVESIVALAAAGVAAIVAVTVPFVTFRLALRQDHLRWLRDRRAEVYVDMLTEAYAEFEYLKFEIADDETRERMKAHFKDLRLPPLERARLGARGTIFASRKVNSLANRLEAQALLVLTAPMRHEGDRTTARVKIGGIVDQLEAAIRAELGADSAR